MFDIVAPDDHELTLPVEIEGVDDAKARHSRPAASRHAQPAPEDQAKDDEYEGPGDQKSDRRGGEHQALARENLVNQSLHRATRSKNVSAP
jgi:hypothetical protein